MTTFQKVAVTAVLAGAASVGFYEARQAANARAEVQALHQSQASLQNELEQMKVENGRLADKAAAVKEQNAISTAQFSELLKLRGQAGQMQTALQQMEKMQAAEQSALPFALPSNVMLGAVEANAKSQAKTNALKTAILKEALNLTDGQAQALNDILNRHTQSNSQHVKGLVSGERSREEVRQAIAADNASREAEIKALLTPDQLSAYSSYQQSEAANAAVQRAGKQLAEVMQVDGVSLSQQQQDALRQAFAELSLSQTSDTAQTVPLNGDDIMNSQQQKLDARLRILEGVLTPDQLKTYQQDQQNRTEFIRGMLKMFFPQKK